MTEYSGGRGFQTWGEKRIQRASTEVCTSVHMRVPVCVGAGAEASSAPLNALQVLSHLNCVKIRLLDKASGRVLLFSLFLTVPPEPHTASNSQELLGECV